MAMNLIKKCVQKSKEYLFKKFVKRIQRQRKMLIIRVLYKMVPNILNYK